MKSRERPPEVLLLGNPNVGKTSLFNELTGSRARVGNYPGVTVERRTGLAELRKADGAKLPFHVTDVPGAYSLCARSAEEQVTMNAVLGFSDEAPPDVLVAVVDASQLSRSFYLVVQLLELRVPLVVALNLVDEAGDAAPDANVMKELLGVPVVRTNGRTGEGTQELLEAVATLLREGATPPRLHVRYAEDVRKLIDTIAERLPANLRKNVERDRAIALWALSSIEVDDELLGIPVSLRAAVLETLPENFDLDLSVAVSRYAAIDAFVESLALPAGPPVHRLTERLDRILLHPISGTIAFLATMLVVFQALFSWSDPAISLIETLVGYLRTFVEASLPRSLFQELLTEGLLGGVGNVIVFLPQILLLFLFIGLLEDSGYMARVAYLMDRIMRSLGLHGRAFVPMLSGFACAVPAILSTRTLERRRDQLLTMLVVPLMTCSARLPVYTLIIGALFPVGSVGPWPVQGLLLIAMYVFSLVISLIAAFVLGRTVVRGKSVPLILELPPYRMPRLVPTLRMMREKAMQFLGEAGTVILVSTIVLWGLLTFPRTPACVPPEATSALVAPGKPCPSDAEQKEQALVDSFGGRLGKAIEPALQPLGFDWKIGTGIIGAFAAREVFVSTMGVVYGVGEVDDDALPLRDKIRAAKKPNGDPVYDPLVGLSLMVFFALACQCMSTLAVVRRETKSYRWPAFLFVYMSVLAYGASFLVYQGGRLLGF